MGTEFIALPATATAADAISAVAAAKTAQPQALVMLYTLTPEGTLDGALSLPQAVQAEPSTTLALIADDDVVIASPSDDVVDITTRMADFNLLALPVVSDDRHIIGLITVDDALEAAIPQDWSRRQTDHRNTGPES